MILEYHLKELFWEVVFVVGYVEAFLRAVARFWKLINDMLQD